MDRRDEAASPNGYPISIFSQKLVLRELGLWRITEEGRSFLAFSSGRSRPITILGARAAPRHPDDRGKRSAWITDPVKDARALAFTCR
jgi:hypothetical protein